MSDDLLERATRALRDTTADESAEARFTRARVMSSLHQGRVRRRARLVFLLPIAACFMAATAWGAATGKLLKVVNVVERAFGVEAQPTTSKPLAPRRVSASSQVTAAQTPPPSVPAPFVSESAAVAAMPPSSEVVPADSKPSVAKQIVAAVPDANGAHSASSSPRPLAKPAPVDAAKSVTQDATLDLYRVAHEAHFVERNPAAALHAWDAYLRAAPGGRFALEASYNRALCLVRLGRNAEARAALKPFADGTHGAYRQKEAAALLERLGAP